MHIHINNVLFLKTRFRQVYFLLKSYQLRLGLAFRCHNQLNIRSVQTRLLITEILLLTSWAWHTIWTLNWDLVLFINIVQIYLTWPWPILLCFPCQVFGVALCFIYEPQCSGALSADFMVTIQNFRELIHFRITKCVQE